MAYYEFLIVLFLMCALVITAMALGFHMAYQKLSATLEYTIKNLQAKPVEIKAEDTTPADRQQYIPPEVFMAHGYADVPDRPVPVGDGETVEDILAKFSATNDDRLFY